MLRNGKTAAETKLRYAGEPSTYEGSFADLAAGEYELEVVAANAKTSNFGRGTMAVTVEPGG
ncbi:MAG TPA: hypothetical protein VG106_15820 [Vicinamibacterales bacterium]|nr:hypothetical protein [Vicinamibacterales bacterium]